MITGTQIKEALVAAGVPEDRLRIEASVVMRSPFPYVYAFLSEDGPDGAYVLVSALEEWESAPEDEMIVARYEDYEAEAEGQQALPLAEAASYAAKLVAEEVTA